MRGRMFVNYLVYVLSDNIVPFPTCMRNLATVIFGVIAPLTCSFYLEQGASIPVLRDGCT